MKKQEWTKNWRIRDIRKILNLPLDLNLAVTTTTNNIPENALPQGQILQQQPLQTLLNRLLLIIKMGQINNN
jgi:hypothetical protein